MRSQDYLRLWRFLVNLQRIGKTLADISIQRECLHCFVAKRPYSDDLLCQLIYEHVHRTNKHGEPCHGSIVVGFYHALGSNIYEDMKLHIEHMHALDFQLKLWANTNKMWRSWQSVTNRWQKIHFFSFPDIRNIYNKRGEELWEKHPSNPINVRMWICENPNFVFLEFLNLFLIIKITLF